VLCGVQEREPDTARDGEQRPVLGARLPDQSFVERLQLVGAGSSFRSAASSAIDVRSSRSSIGGTSMRAAPSCLLRLEHTEQLIDARDLGVLLEARRCPSARRRVREVHTGRVRDRSPRRAARAARTREAAIRPNSTTCPRPSDGELAGAGWSASAESATRRRARS
jgi:hypothetical protein